MRRRQTLRLSLYSSESEELERRARGRLYRSVLIAYSEVPRELIFCCFDQLLLFFDSRTILFGSRFDSVPLVNFLLNHQRPRTLPYLLPSSLYLIRSGRIYTRYRRRSRRTSKANELKLNPVPYSSFPSRQHPFLPSFCDDDARPSSSCDSPFS